MKFETIKKSAKNKTIDFVFITIFSIAIVFLEMGYRYTLGVQVMDRPYEAFGLCLALLIIIRYARYDFIAAITCCFIFFGLLIQLSHLDIYHNWMSPIEVFLFFEQFTEVKAVGLTILDKLLLPCVISLVAVFFALFIFKRREKTKTGLRVFIDFFLLAIFIFPIAQAFYSKSRVENAPPLRYSALKAALITQSLFFGKTLPSQAFNIIDVPAYKAVAPEVDTQAKIEDNIIIIMGESQNIDNMSIFGYNKKTTPFLNDIGAQSFVAKTFAGGTLTDVSIPSFFNMLSEPNGQAHIYSWKTNIFRLAKEQGYKTAFYTAQANNEMGLTNLIGLQFIDDYRTPTDIGYSAIEHAYDEELLPFLASKNMVDGKNFIVLHQRGSHAPYSSRTKKNEKPFGSNSLEDEYNNSVYKTDELIERVYGVLLNKRNSNWTLIYTSDHGQYVKDGAIGHGLLDNKSHYIVPTVIIRSSTNKLNDTREYFSSCHDIFHKNLSEYIVYLMGYKTPPVDCKHGYINGSRLNGSAGYKKINID